MDREKTVFVMVDIQDKFVPVINDINTVLKNSGILAKSAKVLGVPLIVTEQYPRGLGKTSGRIGIDPMNRPIEKVHFSCFGCGEFKRRLHEIDAEHIVLFGIEAHVCILRTALDALESGLKVHVVADAVSSRTKENKAIALERMRQSGAFIVSTEMILFQLMEKAGTDEFKRISELIK